MTWYADLSPCYYHSLTGSGHRAVGWLERGQPFTTGDVSEDFFEKLCQLLQNPWNPCYYFGRHYCDLCRFSGGGEARWRDYTISSSSAASLFVPGCGCLYVAPTNIAHYIDAHDYRPPDEFIRAVLNCPPMRSVDYLKALLENGGRDMVRRAKGRA